MSHWRFFRRCLIPWLVAGIALTACGKKRTEPETRPDPPSPSAAAPAKDGNLTLVFTYGSEKEDWIKEVTAAFNASKRRTPSGKVIRVEAFAQGSGECIEEAILGTPRQVHLTSPASEAYVKLGNARWRARSGDKDLIAKTDTLVLSPVVIAMWKPMAEALGWPRKSIGWADILELAKNPSGWASVGQPQWGQFKFGHTQPEYSNSGLISVLAETYAATGKKDGLTIADVTNPATAQFVGAIEQAVVHYGSSTGFFARKMFANGPSYLSAAVLYESNVIESYDQKKYRDLSFPVVAIYPREGTFWSDHPIGIVEREWTTPDHRQAAKIYIDYLLATPQQQKALPYGFRPTSLEVAVGAPIDAAHGVDPKEPKSTLAVPPPDVLDATLGLWKENKKTSSIALVMDVSGSMAGRRIRAARLGGAQLVQNLSARDSFSLLSFNNSLNWVFKNVRLADGRARAEQAIGGLVEGGGTALYDAIFEAYQFQSERQKSNPGQISAVIVLTDGEDTNSRLKLEQLLGSIRFDSERQPVRIFTIGYGDDASEKILKQIADATQARFYKGTPENIATVFKDIATYF